MKKLLFVQALSPLHAGTGQSTGAIDLPIARDKATGIPLLPGSSLKGSLRAETEELNKSRDAQSKFPVEKLFGAESSADSLNAGDLVIGDANLVFLPVRSIAGTFAYVTSPWILSKLNRDWKEVMGNIINTPTITKTGDCFIYAKDQIKSVLKVDLNNAAHEEKVVFEDLDLKPTAEDMSFVDVLAPVLFTEKSEQDMFKKRVCVVHDDVMSFLCQHAMDVRTRVSIDHDTGTAKDGALWTEESLPTESILCSMVMTRTENNPEAVALMDQLSKNSIQLGGKATVGRGRCKLILK